jgi:predicted transcriptional regulator
MNKSLAKTQAFWGLIQSGKSTKLNYRIYQSLLTEPRTVDFFRSVLKIQHQSCTASLSILEDMGWVYKSKTVKVGKKSFTLFCAETDLIKAKERALSVEKYKKQEWIKRGYRKGWFDTKTAENIALQMNLDLPEEVK